MNYVESFNLFGTEAKQIPCIRASGAPSTSTTGDVGCLYMDIDTGDLYKCTSVTDGVYTWVTIGGAAPTRLASVTLLASEWTGSDSLYSQVVTIPDITEYSKVDLLPSIEQLAIFYNKNVSFVTENEDGVVTVYAIGDKPTLDYTMQVQITEVSV